MLRLLEDLRYASDVRFREDRHLSVVIVHAVQARGKGQKGVSNKLSAWTAQGSGEDGKSLQLGKTRTECIPMHVLVPQLHRSWVGIERSLDSGGERFRLVDRDDVTVIV